MGTDPSGSTTAEKKWCAVPSHFRLCADSFAYATTRKRWHCLTMAWGNWSEPGRGNIAGRMGIRRGTSFAKPSPWRAVARYIFWKSVPPRLEPVASTNKRAGACAAALAMLLLASCAVIGRSETESSLTKTRFETLRADDLIPALSARLGKPSASYERSTCMHPGFDPSPPVVLRAFKAGRLSHAAALQVARSIAGRSGWRPQYSPPGPGHSASFTMRKRFGTWTSESLVEVYGGRIIVYLYPSNNFECH